MIKRMIDYFSRLGKWLLESFHIMVVVITSISIFVFRNQIGQESVELCGAVMQLIGTLYGIALFLSLRASFSFPSLKELFYSWIKRFPTWRKGVHVMNGMIIAPKGIVSGTASFHMPDDNDLPIEERINRLVINQEALRRSLEIAENNNSKKDIFLTGRIEKLESTLSSEISQVNSKLESIHMEDFLWALSGLLFILMGTIFSSFAKYLV